MALWAEPGGNRPCSGDLSWGTGRSHTIQEKSVSCPLHSHNTNEEVGLAFCCCFSFLLFFNVFKPWVRIPEFQTWGYQVWAPVPHESQSVLGGSEHSVFSKVLVLVYFNLKSLNLKSTGINCTGGNKVAWTSRGHTHTHFRRVIVVWAGWTARVQHTPGRTPGCFWAGLVQATFPSRPPRRNTKPWARHYFPPEVWCSSLCLLLQIATSARESGGRGCAAAGYAEPSTALWSRAALTVLIYKRWWYWFSRSHHED